MSHILLIEDEVPLAKALARGMEDRGHEVTLAHDGLVGYRLAKEPAFDVIVIDVMLPGVNGLEICRRLRDDHVDTPILVLTARVLESDETDALDTGADDYLRKPFSLEVLLARCRALTRRPGRREGWNELVLGDLVLNPVRRVVRRGDLEVRLSRRETALLEYLMRARGQVFSKDDILEEVWGRTGNQDTNVVEVYVGYLRRKLDLPGRPSVVRTVRGQGYGLRDSR